LKFGIDFTGGTQMDVKFSQNVPAKEEIEGKLTELNLSGFTIQLSEDNSAIFRYKNSDDETNAQVFKKLQELDENATQLSLDFIGSSISDQLKKSAVEAIIWAIIGIAIFIAWAFRRVSRPVTSWKYGLGAIVALAHDILITVGIFVLLGRFYGVEVGIPFIAALLTILGYSVNDTIVVYDRTRENIIKSNSKEDFEEIVNRSLNETLARSINTSLTVIIVLLALFFFGGESIKDFSLALLIGVGFGTYSSIYVASAILVTIYKYQERSK
jgi:preprotein translocase subunit SecF